MSRRSCLKYFAPMTSGSNGPAVEKKPGHPVNILMHRLLLITLIVLLFAFPSVSRGGEGNIFGHILLDATGKILTADIKGGISGDETYWWDIYQWYGLYATLVRSVDGVEIDGNVEFIFNQNPGNPVDDSANGTAKPLQWPWDLEEGKHEINFRIIDIYRGEHISLGDYKVGTGGVMDDVTIPVYVDEEGDHYIMRREDLSLGIRGETCDLLKLDPVNIATGNSIQFERVFSLPGVGAPLAFDLVYNSRSDVSFGTGYGWTHTFSPVLSHREPILAVTRDSYDAKILHYGNIQIHIPGMGGSGAPISDDMRLEILGADGGISEFLMGTDGRFREKASLPTYVEAVGDDWHWHRRDGSVFVFNGDGRFTKIIRDAGEVTAAYDAQGQLRTITDTATGRSLEFTHEGDFLRSITGPGTPANPSGILAGFDYDVNGNLVSITRADGTGLDYAYTDPHDIHNLTEKRDKQGRLLASWTFNEVDCAVSNTTPDGRGGVVERLDRNTVAVTDAHGNTRTHTTKMWNGLELLSESEGDGPCASCGEDVVKKEYDGHNRVTRRHYADGRVDEYGDYDVNGNAGTETRAAGTPEEQVVRRIFHPLLGVPLTESRAGVTGAGERIVTWDYDDDGNEIPNENPTKRRTESSKGGIRARYRAPLPRSSGSLPSHGIQRGRSLPWTVPSKEALIRPPSHTMP